MPSDELSSVSSLQIFVFDLNVDHLRPVDFFKFEYLISERGIFVLKFSKLVLIPNFECLVVSKLVLELIMLVVIGALEFIDLVL